MSIFVNDTITNGSLGELEFVLLYANNITQNISVTGSNPGVYNVSSFNLSQIGLDSSTNGNSTLFVNATDKAGNSELFSYNITVDNINPNVSDLLFNNTETVFVQNTTHVNITVLAADDDANFGDLREVFVYNTNTPLINTTLSLSSGTIWNVTIVPSSFGCATDGLCDITVQATDYADNTNQTSGSFLVDTTPPQINTVTITPDYVQTDSSIFISVNATKVGSNITTVTANTQDLIFNSSSDLYELETGANTSVWEIVVVDEAGNVASQNSTITLDDVTPLISQFEYNGTGVSNSRDIFRFTANISEMITNGSQGILDEIAIFGNNFTERINMNLDYSTIYTVDLNLSQLGFVNVDGIQNITVFARDKANNSRTQNLSVTIDNTPPIVAGAYEYEEPGFEQTVLADWTTSPAQVIPPSGDFMYFRFADNRTIPWTANVTDVNDIVSVSISSNCSASIFSMNDTGNNSFSISKKNSDFGCFIPSNSNSTDIQLFVRAVDEVDNENIQTFNLTVQKTIPIITLVQLPQQKYEQNYNTIQINFTIQSLADLQQSTSLVKPINLTLRTDSHTYASILLNESDAVNINNVTNTFTFSIPFTPTRAGTHEVYISAVDGLGVEGSISDSDYFESIPKTSATMDVIPDNITTFTRPVTGQTKTHEVNVSIKNIGNANMRDTQFELFVPSGIQSNLTGDTFDCQSLILKNSTCNKKISFTISNPVQLGLRTIPFIVTWDNPDFTTGVTHASSQIFIQDIISHTASSFDVFPTYIENSLFLNSSGNLPIKLYNELDDNTTFFVTVNVTHINNQSLSVSQKDVFKGISFSPTDFQETIEIPTSALDINILNISIHSFANMISDYSEFSNINTPKNISNISGYIEVFSDARNEKFEIPFLFTINSNYSIHMQPVMIDSVLPKDILKHNFTFNSSDSTIITMFNNSQFEIFITNKTTISNEHSLYQSPYYESCKIVSQEKTISTSIVNLSIQCIAPLLKYETQNVSLVLVYNSENTDFIGSTTNIFRNSIIYSDYYPPKIQNVSYNPLTNSSSNLTFQIIDKNTILNSSMWFSSKENIQEQIYVDEIVEINSYTNLTQLTITNTSFLTSSIELGFMVPEIYRNISNFSQKIDLRKDIITNQTSFSPINISVIDTQVFFEEYLGFTHLFIRNNNLFSNQTVSQDSTIYVRVPRLANMVDSYFQLIPQKEKVLLDQPTSMVILENQNETVVVAIADESQNKVHIVSYNLNQSNSTTYYDSIIVSNPISLQKYEDELYIVSRTEPTLYKYSYIYNHVNKSVQIDELDHQNYGDFRIKDAYNTINATILADRLSQSVFAYDSNNNLQRTYTNEFKFPSAITKSNNSFFVLDPVFEYIGYLNQLPNQNFTDINTYDSQNLSNSFIPKIRDLNNINDSIVLLIDTFSAKIHIYDILNESIIQTITHSSIKQPVDAQLVTHNNSYYIHILDSSTKNVVSLNSSKLNETFTFTAAQNSIGLAYPTFVRVDIGNTKRIDVFGNEQGIEFSQQGLLNQTMNISSSQITEAFQSYVQSNCQLSPSYPNLRSYVVDHSIDSPVTVGRFGIEYCTIPITIEQSQVGSIKIQNLGLLYDADYIIPRFHDYIFDNETVTIKGFSQNSQNITVKITGKEIQNVTKIRLTEPYNQLLDNLEKGTYINIIRTIDEFNNYAQFRSAFVISDTARLVSRFVKPGKNINIQFSLISDLVISDLDMDASTQSFSLAQEELFNKTIRDESYILDFEIKSPYAGSLLSQNQTGSFRIYNATFAVNNDSIIFDPVIFDVFALDNVTMPSQTIVPETYDSFAYAGFSVSLNLTSYEKAVISLNYSQLFENIKIQGHEVDANELRVYRCQYNNVSQCSTSDWQLLEDFTINETSQIIQTQTATASSFIVAQRNVTDSDDYNSLPPSPPSSSSSSGGGSSGGGGVIGDVSSPLDQSLSFDSVCGNNICELGENEFNCPLDCSLSPIRFDFSRIAYVSILPGQAINTYVEVRSTIATPTTLSLSFSNPVMEDYITFEENNFVLQPFQTKQIPVTILVPQNNQSRLISSSIRINGAGPDAREFSVVRVATELDLLFDIDIQLEKERISPFDDIFAQIQLRNEFIRNQNVTLEYTIRHLNSQSSTNELILITENILFDREETFARLISLQNETTEKPTDIMDFILNLFSSKDSVIPQGDYIFIFNASYQNINSSQVVRFEVKQQWHESYMFQLLLVVTFAIIVFLALAFISHKVIVHKRKNMRYIIPSLHDLPGREETTQLHVGFIGGTKQSAYITAKDLTTHALVAGSTGSGKSVTASIIVEEALNKKIPAVIFDPTAQWTGFLSPLKDKKIFPMYKKFHMSREEARSYKGLIFTPQNDTFEMDFKDYMHPGEATVFNLSRLTVQEYDVAVKKIIDTMFAQRWEESPDLKLIVVFDEVHRLLDPSTQGLGYEALTKACREFRKWGIGLVMASQVSSDFKEAIGGNVLTEVQLNTKNLEDIHKVEQKYGSEFSDRVTRQGVGVALFQQPKYNKGKPWFIEFRPPLHNPHKLAEEDLDKYDEFTKELLKLKGVMNEFEKLHIDVDDYKMDYNLAYNKLKEGKFKMVEIYVEELRQSLQKNTEYENALQKYIQKQKSKDKSNSVNKSSKQGSQNHSVDKVVSYMRTHIQKGHDIQKIVEHLQKHGVSIQVIQDAKKRLQND